MTEQVSIPDAHRRARGCLLGLAVGDAMGAPAENMTAQAIRERWGEITGFLTEQPSGTDDTEYAAFSALLLLEHGHSLSAAHIADAYRQHLVGRQGGFPGAGFSELGTIVNLLAGLQPPDTGQHLHGWSDGLAMRAAVYGVFAPGDPGTAAKLARIDGSVSHSGEGVHAGAAVAAAVAALMGGADPRTATDYALAAVPATSWTAAGLGTAMHAAAGSWSAEQILDALVTRRYPWTDLGPEALGLAFAAFLRADGEFRRAVTGAVAMGRDADTTAAIAGALSGAFGGESVIPADWRRAAGVVRGRCLGEVVAGQRMDELAERLVTAGLRSTTPRLEGRA
ncbi:ADP-ribosylglycohydrolase family protein [Actinopolymorpha alba]|uniref:ADP-ribosylglycohydrolase family protein n=1 Tax=Actinopolymorpha alba TaxID=533267 RepID=UPI000371BEA8|nr:ADP-ribosylglycohydrolase family protein [Actinopolymorpha alba]